MLQDLKFGRGIRFDWLLRASQSPALSASEQAQLAALVTAHEQYAAILKLAHETFRKYGE